MHPTVWKVLATGQYEEITVAMQSNDVRTASDTKDRPASGPFNSILRRLRFSSSTRDAKPTSDVKSVARPSLEPELIYLARNGWVPNNQHLPVLLYSGVVEPSPTRPTAKFEELFRRNWWMPQSRNSIYDFHHYHSTAHEVLGCARGEARLLLGGEGGHELMMRTGDVLVLPVGVGHRRLDATPDFLVIGAYPLEMDWDICKTAPTPETMERMRRLSVPTFDPVTGLNGRLPKLWAPEVEVKAKPKAKAS
jgi:uncharacterized protein YjlB